MGGTYISIIHLSTLYIGYCLWNRCIANILNCDRPCFKIVEDPLICGSDVLIQPSLVEGISSTILESMACKTPVIASNVGGNLELIINKENGFLTEPDDYDKIIKNLNILLSDKKYAKTITENAFKTVQNYDWKFIGTKYLKLYSSLL